MSITSHHKTVSIDELVIDPKIQRAEGVDHSRVNAIAQGFNPLALGTIALSQRADGRLIVIDGMHRTTGAKQSGFVGFVNAEVITGLTLQQEAELFLLLNNTKTPTALSKFLVRVVMEEPEAVEMNTILEAHGWKVAPGGSTNGVIAAVTAIERVYKNGGGSVKNGAHPELLDRTIEIITAAWEHDVKSAQSQLVLAVAQLLGRYGPSVDTKKLVAEMQGTRPAVLVGRARVLCDAQGGSVPAALAKILAGMHNKKRRSNLLPEWVWIR